MKERERQTERHRGGCFNAAAQACLHFAWLRFHPSILIQIMKITELEKMNRHSKLRANFSILAKKKKLFKCVFFNDVLVWFECDDLSAQKEFSKSENTVKKLSILTSMSHLQLLVVENCLMSLSLSLSFSFSYFLSLHAIMKHSGH